MSAAYEPGEARLLDARLHLLDRQVVDPEGNPVLVVDDLELTDPPDGEIPPGTAAPEVTALLSGPVLLTRVFGGRPPRSRMVAVAWRHVRRIGVTLELALPASDLDVEWVERWVRDHVIGRIPGGRHDPE